MKPKRDAEIQPELLHASSSSVSRALFALGQERSQRRRRSLTLVRQHFVEALANVRTEEEAEKYVARRRFELDLAIRKQPKLASHVIRAAEFETAVEDTGRAKAIYESGLERLAHSVELWNSYATFTETHFGDTERDEVLERALRMLPHAPALWRRRLAAAAASSPAGAVQVALAWLHTSPTTPEAYREIIHALRRARAPADTLRAAHSAAARNLCTAQAWIDWARWDTDPAAVLRAGLAAPRLSTHERALVAVAAADLALASDNIGEAVAAVESVPADEPVVAAARARVLGAGDGNTVLSQRAETVAAAAAAAAAAAGAGGKVPARIAGQLVIVYADLVQYELQRDVHLPSAKLAAAGLRSALSQGLPAQAYAAYAAAAAACPADFGLEEAHEVLLKAGAEAGAAKGAGVLAGAWQAWLVQMRGVEGADWLAETALEGLEQLLGLFDIPTTALVVNDSSVASSGARDQVNENCGKSLYNLANAISTLVLFSSDDLQHRSHRALVSALAAWLSAGPSAPALAAANALRARAGASLPDFSAPLAQALAAGLLPDPDAAAQHLAAPGTAPAALAPLAGTFHGQLLLVKAMAGGSQRKVEALLMDFDSVLKGQILDFMANSTTSLAPAAAAAAATARQQRAELIIAAKTSGLAPEIAKIAIDIDNKREFAGMQIPWPRFSDIKGDGTVGAEAGTTRALSSAMAKWRRMREEKAEQ